MKTHINIGDEVMVATKNQSFDGLVVAKHLFTYSVYHGFHKHTIDIDGTEYHDEGVKIKRYRKSKVFWKSDHIRNFDRSLPDGC